MVIQLPMLGAIKQCKCMVIYFFGACQPKICALVWVGNISLGGGFKYFVFSPLFGEDEPILTSIFFRWVETTN